MKTAKLTEKYQATIPSEVREVLRLGKGDRIAFEIRKDGLVVLRRASPLDEEWANSVNSTLSEWGAAEDEDAFGDL
jgi:AbrB family looped-hinge helix DNA binding protein